MMWRPLALSAAASFAACPATIRLLRRRGVLDIPTQRSSHVAPTPRGGGLAAGVGLLAAALAHRQCTPATGRTLAGPLALGAIGFLDDQRSVSPSLRLASQVWIGSGMGVLATGSLPGTVLGAVLTPALVNATNFMDGVNGISGFTAALWGLSVAPLAAGPDEALAFLGMATAGAYAGFLPYNIPQAQLFLGDVGSYLLGGLFTAGVLNADSLRSSALVLAPLCVHLADTATTLVRRARRGEVLTQAHREHTYQRLVSEHGFTHLQVSALAAGTAAVVTALSRRPATVPLALLVLAGYVTLPEILDRCTQPSAAVHPTPQEPGL